MSNPNWPLFPNVPNMTADDEGRPEVLDHISGKQKGTPLNKDLINPIIHTLCDLRDDVDGLHTSLPTYLPLKGGNITGELDIAGKKVATIDDVATETHRAKEAEAGLLPLTGGKLSGGLSIGGQFSQNGETLSKPLGTQIGNGRFYMQAIQPDNVDHIAGRLLINDLDGRYYRVLEADTNGTLKNVNGQILATTDDIQTETTRAKNAEATLLPLSGGKVSGDLLVASSFYQNGETLSKTIGTQVGTGQFYMQAVQPDNVSHLSGRLVLKDLDGNFYRVLEANKDGTLKNVNGQILATTDDIQTETTRAQNVESTLLPLTGGNISGDLNLHGNVFKGGIASRALSLSVKGDEAKSTLQLLGTKASPVTTLALTASDGRKASLTLNANNRVTTARGTCLPEMLVTSDQPSGRIVIQVFSAMASNGTVITFPNEFLQVPYTVILDTESETSDTNNVIVNVAIGTLTTKSFELRKRWVQGGSDAIDGISAPVRITAIGVIA